MGREPRLTLLNWRMVDWQICPSLLAQEFDERTTGAFRTNGWFKYNTTYVQNALVALKRAVWIIPLKGREASGRV